MPTKEEAIAFSNHNLRRGGIGGFGCIDGTHIQIQKPTGIIQPIIFLTLFNYFLPSYFKILSVLRPVWSLKDFSTGNTIIA